MELTQEYVKGLFDYKDGFLYWKVNMRANKVAGKVAGSIRNDKKRPDYKRIYLTINNKNYSCARIIFLWHHGWLPLIVDHENRIPFDDRIKNLRAADYSGNSKNRSSAKGSSSKYLGVSKKGSKWATTMTVKPHKLKIGLFNSESDAALAYNSAAVKHHGEFANLNIIQPS